MSEAARYHLCACVHGPHADAPAPVRVSYAEELGAILEIRDPDGRLVWKGYGKGNITLLPEDAEDFLYSDRRIPYTRPDRIVIQIQQTARTE